MPLTTLLFKVGVAKIDQIELDAVLSEGHEGDVEVTKHPVEKGFAVSDHARPQPDRFTLTGVVSNTPLNRTQTRRAITSAGFNLETSATQNTPQGKPGNAEDALLKLRELKANPRVITVVTGILTYDDMIMTKLVVPRDGTTGDVLKFTATFEKMSIVENAVTTVKVAREPKAHKKKKAGPVAAKETPEETKKKSLGVQLIESFDKDGVSKVVDYLTPGAQ